MQPNNLTDSTLDIVLLIAFAISAIIAFKVAFERIAILRSGRVPSNSGSMWFPLAMILAVVLLAVNAR